MSKMNYSKGAARGLPGAWGCAGYDVSPATKSKKRRHRKPSKKILQARATRKALVKKRLNNQDEAMKRYEQRKGSFTIIKATVKD